MSSILIGDISININIMDFIILKSFLPEFFLSISILFQLIFNIRIIKNSFFNYPIIDKEVFYQTIFILICLLFLYYNLKIEGFFSNFLFINDESTKLIKILILLSCVFTLNIIFQAFSLQFLNFFEFFTVFLLALLALLLLISVHDLLTFYLIIEMQSLCFYILAGFKRNSAFSAEAGLKYFISGAFMSGIFLLGCSILYGCVGTLNLNLLTLLFAFPLKYIGIESLIGFSILCITATLLFKIACAPFHFWSPDVYEGAPLSSTIIFSIIPKFSLIFFFIKWICCLNILFININNYLLFCGSFSIFLGTLFALSQKRLKKLIIYSSIAQTGFLVAGLSTNSLDGFVAVFFFLIIYTITSILAWSHISLFYSFQKKINFFYKKSINSLYVSSLTNFFQFNKLWTFSLIVIFFSIGGIPPLTGFLSKILILFEVLKSKNILVVIFLIVISALSVFYYIRMIKIISFEPKKLNVYYENCQTIFYNSFLDNIYLTIALLLIILIVLLFYPTILILFCQYIVLNITFF